jgi:hypothetical protein
MFDFLKKPRTPDENNLFIADMIANGGGASAPAHAATLIKPVSKFDEESAIVKAMLEVGMGERVPSSEQKYKPS